MESPLRSHWKRRHDALPLENANGGRGDKGIMATPPGWSAASQDVIASHEVSPQRPPVAPSRSDEFC